MDGIIILDKPEDFTSFDMVAKMRRLLGTRKVGHAGTLDPMATGVLPIFVGRATKCCDILPNQNKRYTATFQLGYTTDTLDATGRVLTRTEVSATKEDVEKALESFRGEIMQLPPMYSAIQINGKRLYDLARQGIEIEREKRPVTITELELLSADDTQHIYQIDVACSKGTYIRTLCADIGEALGCGAIMTALRRTEAAGFSIADSITLEEAEKLSEEGTLTERLLPIRTVFESLPALHLASRQQTLFQNGVKLDIARLNEMKTMQGYTGDIRVMGEDDVFLGISVADWENGELKMKKLFSILEG